MFERSIESTVSNTKATEVAATKSQYAAPSMYVIGRSDVLLQGSGRHKNDDTGRRGFVVDQY